MKGKGTFARKRRCEGALVPGRKTRRSDNRERPRALGDQLRIEHVERNAAKMVGMEMREQDEVDRVAVDAKPLHRDERRGAAINQKTDSVRGHVKARIESAARSERIPRAHKSNTQPGPPALGATTLIYAKAGRRNTSRSLW